MSSPSSPNMSSAPSSAVAPPVITGAQWATAFDSPAPPARTTSLYRISILFVFFAMILLPVVYFAIIAAAIAAIHWYAVNASGMLSLHLGRAIIFVLVIYVAPLIAGGLLVLFMILPLFWRSSKSARPMWVDRREQPLLYAYIDKMCDAMGAPRPARIDVLAGANASAHIDNGLLGLFMPRLVLTIGLPLVQALDLRQFTGVMAHELGHFAQGGFMRLSYIVQRINMWFFRLAYGRSGIDDMLDEMVDSDSHWIMMIIGGLAKLVLWLARVVLMALALLSHALSMRLSRQAEFDADRQAARIVGSQAMGEALQAIPYLSAANEHALVRARASWEDHILPDDLVILTHGFYRAMPSALKEKITSLILQEDVSWFDTHPPLFKRVATLKKTTNPPILKLNGPAILLFKDFDELSKLTTIQLYQSILGQALLPEHLVPTLASAEPAKPAISR